MTEQEEYQDEDYYYEEPSSMSWVTIVIILLGLTLIVFFIYILNYNLTTSPLQTKINKFECTDETLQNCAWTEEVTSLIFYDDCEKVDGINCELLYLNDEECFEQCNKNWSDNTYYTNLTASLLTIEWLDKVCKDKGSHYYQCDNTLNDKYIKYYVFIEEDEI